MRALSDYIHARGLKFGIYSSAGLLTCGKMAGSLGKEEQDAQLFMSFDIDYFKYDNCFPQVLKIDFKLPFFLDHEYLPLSFDPGRSESVRHGLRGERGALAELLPVSPRALPLRAHDPGHPQAPRGQERDRGALPLRLGKRGAVGTGFTGASLEDFKGHPVSTKKPVQVETKRDADQNCFIFKYTS